MKILYVIGNGFDLWHGLPTKYRDFHKFAAIHLDELELWNYLNIEPSSETLWNNFESNLGKFDPDIFYDTHNFIDVADESFRPSMVYGLEDDITEQADNLVDVIQSQFHEWIESIPVEDAAAKFEFRFMGRFFSFNYTSLLQTVYEIPNDLVFHIHGSVSEYDDLIFGHGESMEEEPEQDEYGDSNRTIFTDAEGAAKYPFYALQKSVNEILNRNLDYFESLNNIEAVVIIGHSLNEIDIPYIQKISDIALNCKWVVSKYSETEGKNHIRQLEKCGVAADQITLCSIDDIPKVLERMHSSL